MSGDAWILALGVILGALAGLPWAMALGTRPYARRYSRRGEGDVRIVHQHLHVHASELGQAHAGQLEVRR